MGATNKYLGVCGSCGIDRAVFDAQTKKLAEAREDVARFEAELDKANRDLADARHKMAQADIDTMHAKAELAAMTARKDGWRLIALAALRECYSEWVGGEIRDTDDYWKMFDMMNAELRDRMDDIRAGVPMWRVRHD